MAGLKALVIIMGLLIVVGITVIGTVIFQRAGNLAGDKTPASIPASTPAPAPAPMAKGTITLPKGARIIETSMGNGRILFRLDLGDGRQQIKIVDSVTGRPVATHGVTHGVTHGATVGTAP